MPTQAEIEAAARALCILEGHAPDAIGEPPNDVGAATLAHAFPRWMTWQHQAAAALEAAERVRTSVQQAAHSGSQPQEKTKG